MKFQKIERRTAPSLTFQSHQWANICFPSYFCLHNPIMTDISISIYLFEQKNATANENKSDYSCVYARSFRSAAFGNCFSPQAWLCKSRDPRKSKERRSSEEHNRLPQSITIFSTANSGIRTKKIENSKTLACSYKTRRFSTHLRHSFN
jgi:hypothetical protein